MIRRLSALSAGLGVLLLGSVASAQPAGPNEFGHQGQLIFSADRLVPLFAFSSNHMDSFAPVPGSQADNWTTNQTSISFFWGNNGSIAPNASGAGINDVGTSNVFQVPRLGVDYALMDHFTLGGDLILFFTLGGSTTHHVQNGGVTSDTTNTSPGVLVFGFAPRAGYVLNLNPQFALWLRGGLSFYQGQSKRTDTATNTTFTDSFNTLGLDLDPQLVWAPMPHFAFTAGPAFDLGFGGHVSQETQTPGSDTTTSVGYQPINFSIELGMLGWFNL
jgi:hypothetical protein